MNSFDTIWNDIYESGHVNRYPWDTVVTFVFRYFPKDKERSKTKILEIGCGGGNNLLFCAKEGFTVIGVDACKKALDFAANLFRKENVDGTFLEENFTALSLSDNSVDLVIDRASLTCTPMDTIIQSIAEIKRVLKPGGRFLFIPYSDAHSSAATGLFDIDQRMAKDIKAGSLTNVGQISFISLNDIKMLFPEHSWRFIQIQRSENVDVLNHQYPIHGEFRVVVELLEN